MQGSVQDASGLADVHRRKPPPDPDGRALARVCVPGAAARSACRSPNCGHRGGVCVRLPTPTGPNGPGNRTDGEGVNPCDRGFCMVAWCLRTSRQVDFPLFM